jgi:hypothetical protein
LKVRFDAISEYTIITFRVDPFKAYANVYNVCHIH